MRLFSLAKKGSLSATNDSGGGFNLLKHKPVSANDDHAILSISRDNSGSIILKGGSNWATGGKSISLVSSSNKMFSKSNPTLAIQAYNNGNPVSKIKPNASQHIYIFKIVSGPDSFDNYYGLLNTTGNVAFSYRIGHRYEDLLTMEL